MNKWVIINDLHRSLHPPLQSQHDILSGVSVMSICQRTIITMQSQLISVKINS